MSTNLLHAPSRCPTPLKKAYTTKKRAKFVAAVTGRDAGRKINIYKCPFCRYFHLTSRQITKV